MLYGIVAGRIANLVVQIVHQPTLLNGQNLVESTSDVEADGWIGLSRSVECGVWSEITLCVGTILTPHSTLLTPRFYLFLCQPSLVGTAVVELVAILLRLYAAKDGAELGQLHLSDAMQLVVDLLLLELELLLVGQILPLATATDAEVLTERCRAYLTIINKAHYLAFSEGMLLATNLHVAHIARHTERYEHHEFVPVEQTLTLSCYSLYRNALKER